jgi:hypothetical protein
MGSADDIDLEGSLKDQMDFGTLRDAVISLIWQDNMEGLRQLCEQQIMLPLVLEKIIDEIAPGNRWNDALFLMSRRLIEADPRMADCREQLKKKMPLVSNPSGGREILRPFVREEISPADFMNRLKLIADTHVFMGLDSLVSENPHTTRSYIRQVVAQLGGKLDPDTRLFQLLCEMAVSYRNHHHQSDLLSLLEEAGGTLRLLKNSDDIGSIRVFTGPEALGGVLEEERRATEVLNSGDLDAALALYEEVLPKMDALFSDWTGVWEYANALLFSAVLLSLKGEVVAAQERLLKCMNTHSFVPGVEGYATLLLMNVQLLQENKDAVRKAFGCVARDAASDTAFDRFFECASGHSYAEVNKLYERFLVAAGDREMDEAFELSEKLLEGYKARRSALVPNSLCEFLVRMFRACRFALQGDMSRAEREYIEASPGEVSAADLRSSFEKIAADPERVLAGYFGE